MATNSSVQRDPHSSSIKAPNVSGNRWVGVASSNIDINGKTNGGKETRLGPQSQRKPNYGPYSQAALEKNPKGSGYAQPEFSMRWYKDEDIEAFREALAADPDAGTPDHPHVEQISAVPDYAPIKQRIKRPAKRNRDIVREGWAYHAARWPILAFISLAIILQFSLYVLVRQWVNFIEWAGTWRGRRGELRQQLRKAKDYDEWKQAALELDEYLGFSKWKKTNANAYYDSALVRRVVENLQELREKEDAEAVRAVLEVCLRSNFAGVESFRLYSETFLGTKELIERYVDEVERSLAYLRNTDRLKAHEKTHFFKVAAKNFGSSALCLSGGASFGYYHFGVIRALLDAKLLPTVITGTSAGALVAAFLCTHTDSELFRLLTPELADMITACDDSVFTWLTRFWRTGARFDAVDWAKKSGFFTMGSMTFLEAYERTGRVLNVSVIPYNTHSPTKLLNYVTAPHCVIFSAIIASAAVPGIINPVVLMEKTRKGDLRPWEIQGRHKDGSLRVDVPLEGLHLYFNTVYSIVSQVNPHIHPFFFQQRGAPGRPVAHRRGKGWRGGFFLSALEQVLKIELMKNFRVMRDLELMPEFAGQNWTAVFLQRYEGSVTIWPKSRAWDWVRLLTDPDRNELARMIDVGKRVTWPKLHMIENRLRIERQIFGGREEFGNPAEGHMTLESGFTPRRRYDALDTHSCDVTDATNSASELEVSPANRPRKLQPLHTESADLLQESEDDDFQNRKRRRAIMVKLGLRGRGPNESNDGTSTEEGGPPSSLQRLATRQNEKGKKRESTLRRRHSFGALKHTKPIKGQRHSSLGPEGSGFEGSEHEGEDQATSCGEREAMG